VTGHTSEDEDISPFQSDSDNEGEEMAETGYRQWTYTTHSQPSAPVIHRFTEGLSGLIQNKAPNIKKV
jgi:hypothetical protein